MGPLLERRPAVHAELPEVLHWAGVWRFDAVEMLSHAADFLELWMAVYLLQ